MVLKPFRSCRRMCNEFKTRECGNWPRSCTRSFQKKKVPAAADAYAEFGPEVTCATRRRRSSDDVSTRAPLPAGLVNHLPATENILDDPAIEIRHTIISLIQMTVSACACVGAARGACPARVGNGRAISFYLDASALFPSPFPHVHCYCCYCARCPVR